MLHAAGSQGQAAAQSPDMGLICHQCVHAYFKVSRSIAVHPRVWCKKGVANGLTGNLQYLQCYSAIPHSDCVAKKAWKQLKRLGDT